jgi:hypothetical protein
MARFSAYRSLAVALFAVTLAVFPAPPLRAVERQAGPPPPSLAEPDTESVRQVNDAARYCAGLPVSDKSPLYILTQTDAWKAFAEKENARWKSLEPIARKVRTWANDNLRPRTPDTGVVFYPFGGPDILYADLFFPEAKLYILVGLEAVGSFPNEQAILDRPLAPFLEGFRRGLDDIFRYSFFARFDMEAQLSPRTLTGVLPIFLVLLARMGDEVVSFETGGLDAWGMFRSRGAVPEGAEPNRALRIRYRGPEKRGLTTLVFLSQDLSNEKVDGNLGFGAFLDRTLPDCFTFIKAASYLMHNKGFSLIRNRILRDSAAVLQDDSGIMYRMFDPLIWKTAIFGTYTGPIKMFKEYHEDSLAAAVPKDNKPLDFRFGYGKGSLITWAVKKVQ